jgi:hypothetical protein
MNLVNRQLAWYGGDIFEQDNKLLQFIEQHNLKGIKYLGDCEHVSAICKNAATDYQLIVYIVNSLFKFGDVIQTCNNELERLKGNGFLYLSINKFLAHHEKHCQVVDDYDNAIYDLITGHIHYKLLSYYSGQVDGGIKFNWAHPITRFYFSNENITPN